MSARAHSERSERPPETEPRAEAAGGPPVAAALLALQRTAGNRAVRSLIAREPGADAPPPVERDIREFEDTLGQPLADADRKAMERALSAPRTAESGHSAFELGATALAHPIKTAEHVGPKALMPDKLSEEHYLLDRFPNLFPELVRFFASTDEKLPTVNVQTLYEFQFAGPPYEAYNVYQYLQARNGEVPMPRRIDVTPSMFGDEPQGEVERSLLLGPFNVLPQRVHLQQEPGYEEHQQFRLRVTDTLGLGEGQQGLFYALSFVIGQKHVVLADYLGTVDASGKVEIKPWPHRYDPPLGRQCDAAGNCFEP